MTKASHKGEEIRWTGLGCECSTEWAFNNHWSLNSQVPSSVHMFAFKTTDGGYAPMHHEWFLSQCYKFWTSSNLKTLSGHRFRIGGMTHLLLLGIDSFIAMAQGCWNSTAFLEYWNVKLSLLSLAFLSLQNCPSCQTCAL